MEHQDAIATYTAEGYLLDDLTDEQRKAFEQHFADCESCFADVRDGVRFIHALPEAVKEEKGTSRWPLMAAWPSLAAAAGIAVALTAVVAQVAVIAPMQTQMARLRAPHVVTRYTFTASRGSTSRPVVNGREPWILEFDIAIDAPAPYTCTLVDAHGKKWPIAVVSAEQARKRIEVEMSGGLLPAGDYTLMVAGAGGVPQPIETFKVQ